MKKRVLAIRSLSAFPFIPYTKLMPIKGVKWNENGRRQSGEKKRRKNRFLWCRQQHTHTLNTTNDNRQRLTDPVLRANYGLSDLNVFMNWYVRVCCEYSILLQPLLLSLYRQRTAVYVCESWPNRLNWHRNNKNSSTVYSIRSSFAFTNRWRTFHFQVLLSSTVKSIP